MCRVLKVSKSGYYGWRSRPPSARAKADAALSEWIGRVHRDSRETTVRPASTPSRALSASGAGGRGWRG